jgi:hypothetical protein
MKNSKLFSVAPLVALVVSALPSTAKAFELKHVSTQDVSDANFCGDYNKMVTYDLTLDPSERLPESELSLISPKNLTLIENELRTRFYFSKSAGRLVIKKSGEEVAQDFALPDLDTQNYCFGVNFEDLFGFNMKGRKAVPRNPGAVTYLSATLLGGETMGSTATVVIDRIRGKLYIHQIW